MKFSNRVSLKEYLEKRIDDQENLILTLLNESKELTDAKFDTYRSLLDSNAEKVALALSAADKAIAREAATTNERLHLLNELRSGVATKEQMGALERRVDDIKERLDTNEGKDKGQLSADTLKRASQQQAVAVVGAIVAIVAVAVALILGLNG